MVKPIEKLRDLITTGIRERSTMCKSSLEWAELHGLRLFLSGYKSRKQIEETTIIEITKRIDELIEK
jgi:hypothetical protein